MLELSNEHVERYKIEYTKKLESGVNKVSDIVHTSSSPKSFKVSSGLLREVIGDAHVDPLSHPLISNGLVSYSQEDLNVQIEKVEIVTKTVITVVTSKKE